MKQSKADVIATNINALKRNVMHNNVYITNRMNDFNNLSHNEQHLNVSKVYLSKCCFCFKMYGQPWCTK